MSTMKPMEIRKRTPMTERLVSGILRRTGEVGLCDKDNRMAYRWRRFELRFPKIAKAAGLFQFGPGVALGIYK